MTKQELIVLLRTDVAEFNRQRPRGYIDLTGADLIMANLCRANLIDANLCRANLTDANLRGANLYRADLIMANLTKTVLDPANKPNADVSEFECDGEYIIGYRTKHSNCGSDYEAGQCYHAPYFSTCETECHPGLYLAPSMEWLEKRCCRGPYVKVWAKPGLTHRAGNKWRTKCFFRVEDVESDYLEGRNNG